MGLIFNGNNGTDTISATDGSLVIDGLDLGGVGNINAGIGTFSGNLNVGGVLTYEDVKNVDSVGVITARAGIIDSTLTAGRIVYVDSDKSLTDSATLLYDGNHLQNVQSGVAANLTLKTTGNSFNSLILDSNRAADTQFAIIDGRWNGNVVNRIQFVSGSKHRVKLRA